MTADRTLLLEDHPDTQVWMSAILRRAFPGTVIDVARTVSEARMRLRRETYKRAIVDLSLPDGTGLEIIALAAKEHPDLSVVVATIFDDEANIIAALKAGAKGYVLKDQCESALIRVLEGLRVGQPPLSPAIARQILESFRVSRRDITGPKGGRLPNDKSGALTEREAEVLEIIARGASKRDVANSLKISANTVGAHIKSIYRKLGISSRAEASLAARRMGLLNPDEDDRFSREKPADNAGASGFAGASKNTLDAMLQKRFRVNGLK